MFKRVLYALALCLLPALAGAQEVSPPLSGAEGAWKEGQHYDLITPAQHTADSSKVEVAEFFWYGCGHCYSFEPLLSNWKQHLPEGVYFRGIPAMWGGPMELHARAFYAAQLLGIEDKVGPAMFATLHEDHAALRTPKDIAALFAGFGVADDDFYKTFDSFGVGSQVRQADAAARGAKLTGTPSLMINGKYMISASKAGSHSNMLKIADYLIAQELAARAK